MSGQPLVRTGARHVWGENTRTAPRQFRCALQSFAISTVRFLMCGGACSRVMKTEPSLMSSTVASTIWSVSSTGSLRVHIRRSLHQGARTRRGREADAPTVPGRGRGGAYHTRVPLLIGMLKLSACAGCADARAVIWGMRKALAAIAVSRGRNCSGRNFFAHEIPELLLRACQLGCPGLPPAEP